MTLPSSLPDPKLECASFCPPQPSTVRGQSYHLDYDIENNRLVYVGGKSVYIRSIDDPSQCIVYSEHNACVTVAKMSPSGIYVASGDALGNVRIWDISSKSLKYTGKVLGGKIRDISWDIDSQHLMIVGDAGIGNNFGVILSYDSGKYIGEAISGSDDGQVNLHTNFPTTFSSSSTKHDGKFVHKVSFSPDGNFAISTGSDGQIFRYEISAGISNPVCLLNIKGTSIYNAAWNSDSKQILLACGDGVVRIISAFDGSIVGELPTIQNNPLDKQFVGCVWLSSQKVSLLSASGKISFICFNSNNSFSLDDVWLGHSAAISSLSASGKRDFITLDINDKYLSWNISANEFKYALVPNLLPLDLKEQFTDLISCPDGNNLITTNDRCMMLVKESHILWKIQLSGHPKVVSISHSWADKDFVVFILLDKMIFMNDLKTGKLLCQTSLTSEACSLAIRSGVDGLLAIGHENGKISLYDKNLQIISDSFSAATAQVTSLAFTCRDSSSLYLAAGDGSRRVTLYSIENTATIKAIKLLIQYEWIFHTARVTSLAWTCTKKEDHSTLYLLSSGLDKRLILWNPLEPSFHKIINLSSTSGGGCITNLLSLENELVVSAADDGTVGLWKITQDL